MKGGSSFAHAVRVGSALAQPAGSRRLRSARAQVIYVREGVAAVVARRERIMGRLSLIKQARVMFLAWLPYSPGSVLPDGTLHPPPTVVASSPAPAARGRAQRTCTLWHVVGKARTPHDLLPQVIAPRSEPLQHHALHLRLLGFEV